SSRMYFSSLPRQPRPTRFPYTTLFRSVRPATALLRGEHVKADIHPEYVVTQVTCTCGNSFVTRSTKADGSIRTDICSACHPFYTGKQKIMDTGGRVARFEKRFGKRK